MRRFCQKCKLYPSSLKLHIWGIWSIRNSVLTMKIRLDALLRVYKPIFQKVWILFPDPVIAYFGLLWYQELIYEHRISSGLIIEGLHVDCAKTVNLSPWAYNCIFRVFKYQKLNCDNKNYPRSNTAVLQVNFSKRVNIIHWPCNGIFGGRLVSETH